jgi:biotin synthase
MKKLLYKLYKTNFLELDELLYVLNNMDTNSKEKLFEYAHKVRVDNYDNKVFIRGIVEFSNYCCRTCRYCGIRAANKDITRYRLSSEEIFECCRRGYDIGYRTFVLQSGEDYFYSDEMLIKLVLDLKKSFSDAAITLSIGEKSYELYKKLYDAGVDRFLLRHETASENLYKELHPRMCFKNRINCLKQLKEIGYQVGAGFIVGLPGQTNEIIAQDLFFLKKLKPHMVGIGPFVPHPKTPLKDFKHGSAELTLISLAITRMLLPNVLLPVTTALNTIDETGRTKGLKAGANVIMPNLTPLSARKKYEIYENKKITDYEEAELIKKIKIDIENEGFILDMSRGDHILWEK